MGADKRTMVLIYSHSDRRFLDRTKFLDFLYAVADEEDLEFWWDEEGTALWDQEIRRKLEDAAVVICLVSQSFLRSTYITEVEARRTYERLIDDGICVVPVMYQACLWEDHEWLKKVNHLPKDGYVFGHRNQPKLFLEIAQYTKKCLGRSKLFHKGKALYTLRRLPDATFTSRQRQLLVEDSIQRADKFVPDRAVQRKICAAARAALKKGGTEVLNKRQLEDLDRRFLLKPGDKRRPDAKKVRWVLRACEVHPQGRTWE